MIELLRFSPTKKTGSALTELLKYEDSAFLSETFANILKTNKKLGEGKEKRTKEDVRHFD
jgi:hypothetical protein